MTALIVGGDYVEPLKREIRAHGYAQVEHWDGRKVGFTKKAIPGGTRLIVILIDYISHSLLAALKRQASRNNVPLVFCKRSMNDLRRKLDDIGASEGGSYRRQAPGETPAAEKYMALGDFSHRHTADAASAVRVGADLLQGRNPGKPVRALESVSKRAAADLQHQGYAW